MTRPKVTCKRCGVGMEPLDSNLWAVLQQVIQRGWVHAGDCLKNGKHRVTASYFALQELKRMGLVIREKDGRKWKYTSVSKS